MPRADDSLFKVLMGPSKDELPPDFIARSADRIAKCVSELLAVVGYHGRVQPVLGQSTEQWHVNLLVERRLLVQLDLFSSQGVLPTVSQVSDQVIEAAVIAIARFRRETPGVLAARLHETLKHLKSADPRVIAAIARQPGRKLTIRREAGDLELNLQTESHRSLSSDPEALICVIVAVGYEEMSVVPVNRRTPRHMCMHPARVRIPRELRERFDPKNVLDELVRPRRRLEIVVRREIVVRKRQHATFELAQWPPPDVRS